MAPRAWACGLISVVLLSMAVAAQADEHSVTVNVLTFATRGDGTPFGFLCPVRITAGASDGNSVRVGFFESEVGGAGNQWRSAGWMAAVTASTLSDFSPRTMRVSFEYEGRIDGPSAGVLMTCGVLAAARGDEVRPDVAMTGTVNPDGSIGPVSGIMYKIQGAAERGIKVVLIPAGLRFETNLDGEKVDLVEHGHALGVKVIGVFDVYHAYKLLTGTDLPRPTAAHAPQISLSAQKQIRNKLDVWADRYEQSLKSFMELKNTSALSQEIVDMYQKGGDAIKRSNELIEEGEFTAALWDRVVGAAHGYLALESGRCSYTYDTRGYEGLVERLKNNGWLENEVRKVAARMREQSPQTLDQLSVYLIACDAFLEAVTLQRLVQVMLNSLPEEESKETLNDAYSATSNQIAAWLDLKLVADYLDMMPGYEGQPIPVNAPWRQVSDYLRRASNANMAVFDTVVVEPAARHLSMSADLARARLMKRDKVYAIIRGAEHLVFPELGNYFGDSDAWGYAFLATSMYTHTRAAGLLAKYVSLDAELNDDGFVIGLKRERLLADWLTYSEDQTRRNIALLQESGVDASPVAQMYSLARIQARRKVTEQMEALVDF